MDELESQGTNLIRWTAQNLQQVFFRTYPHVSRPVSPGALVLSLALSHTPIFGDLYDLYSGRVPCGRDYDPITGQYLAGWERLANIADAIPIFGVSGANIRHGMHLAEFFVGQGDEIAQFMGAAGKSCSFDEDTPVASAKGPFPSAKSMSVTRYWPGMKRPAPRVGYDQTSPSPSCACCC